MFGFLRSDTKKLFDAIKAGDSDKAERLVDKMDNVGQQDSFGNTALLWAIFKKNYYIADKLIDKMSVSDIQKHNKNRENALFGAIKVNWGDNAITEKLIDKMVDVSQQGECNTTALMVAVIAEDGEIAEKLIDKMDDFSQQGEYGLTALMVAIAKGDDYIAEKLIDKMEDFSQQDTKGNTALMLANKTNNSKIEALIKAKIECRQKMSNDFVEKAKKLQKVKEAVANKSQQQRRTTTKIYRRK